VPPGSFPGVAGKEPPDWGAPTLASDSLPIGDQSAAIENGRSERGRLGNRPPSVRRQRLRRPCRRIVPPGRVAQDRVRGNAIVSAGDDRPPPGSPKGWPVSQRRKQGCDSGILTKPAAADLCDTLHVPLAAAREASASMSSRASPLGLARRTVFWAAWSDALSVRGGARGRGARDGQVTLCSRADISSI
jgi:hypothetical protein